MNGTTNCVLYSIQISIECDSLSFLEFLMVLVGLVGASAISEVLVFWGWLIRCWPKVDQPQLILLATVWIVMNLVAHISGLWNYRSVEFGQMYQTYLIVLPVIAIAMSITVLIPASNLEEIDDFDSYYFRVVRPATVLCAVHAALALLADQLPGAAAPPMSVMLVEIGLLILMSVVRTEIVHYTAWSALHFLLWGAVIASGGYVE